MTVTAYTKVELETSGWLFTSLDNEDGTFTVSVEKTVVSDDETETEYTFSRTATTEADAENVCILYASMVDYGLIVEHWQPQDLAFPKSQLYQFIQPETLAHLEAIYPDVVISGYNNALAYVQSYIGAMFDVAAMLDAGGSTQTALTLRLALCLSTVTFILASSPQYSEVIMQQDKQLHQLLRGLKSGNRSFGKTAIVGEPNVRVSVVSLGNNGSRP
jgi:hypothetical protein